MSWTRKYPNPLLKGKYRFLQIISIANKIRHIGRCAGPTLVGAVQGLPQRSVMKKLVLKPLFVLVLVAVVGGFWRFLQASGQEKHSTFEPTIPRVWDDHAIATLEVPLADPVGSPKH